MSLNYKKNSLKKPPKSNLRLVIPTVAFCSLSAISAIVLNIPLTLFQSCSNVINKMSLQHNKWTLYSMTSLHNLNMYVYTIHSLNIVHCMVHLPLNDLLNM